MLEFIILMVVLEVLRRITVGEAVNTEPPKKESKAKAYCMGNSAEWDFESLDDAMEFRELRKSGWKGNAIDYYKWKSEE